MRSQEVSRSPLQAVWFAGIGWGTALGAALGAIVANALWWVSGGSEARTGWELIAGIGGFGLAGTIFGAAFGFVLGCLTGFIAGVLLSTLLGRCNSTRSAAAATVGGVWVTLVATTVFLSEGFDDGGWTALVVPAIAIYPLTRAVVRAARLHEAAGVNP